MSEAASASVLLVSSSGAPPHAVVPVLAAAEAAGLRVRAIDLGGAGAPGSSVTDRVRRALLGEGAERRLRKELELSPPDVAVVFDPHSAQALTVARDEVANPAPVVAVVAELSPASDWAQTDADRFLALDDEAAVALADAGVEPDRILVCGAIGEVAFALAGQLDRAAARRKFNLSGQVVLVEVAGLGAEETGQLALQLSLLDGQDRAMFLFDAAGDAEAAAVLRRSVPTLGLRAKLFGATSDSAALWRSADVVIARPTPRACARIALLGARLVALVNDSAPGLAAAASALELRKQALPARGLLLLTSALDSALRLGAPPAPSADGAAVCAEILRVLAADKRAVIDERRAAQTAATRDRIRTASTAAGATTRAAAMPGDLEDLSGEADLAGAEEVMASVDVGELAAEGKRRLAELTKAMSAAQRGAEASANQASAQRARGETEAAAASERKSAAERARMHALLAEMATLERELAELAKVAAAAPRAAAGGGSARAAAPPPKRATVDDMLADLKRTAGPAAGAGGGGGGGSAAPPPPRPGAGPRKADELDFELAALKQKMAQQPGKKKG